MKEETRAAIAMRHKLEWKKFRENVLERLMENSDPDAHKAAKGIADVLKSYQEGERKAWGFEDEIPLDSTLTVSWQD